MAERSVLKRRVAELDIRERKDRNLQVRIFTFTPSNNTSSIRTFEENHHTKVETTESK